MFYRDSGKQHPSARCRRIPHLPTIRWSDYRPIAITPVLSRIMERLVDRQFIYPALLMLPSSLVFSDQFAFKLTGSTSAAITSTSCKLSPTCCLIIRTLLSSVSISARHLTLSATSRYYRSWHRWISVMLSTAGWLISSPDIRTVPHTAARHLCCARSLPALYRSQRLARCHS